QPHRQKERALLAHRGLRLAHAPRRPLPREPRRLRSVEEEARGEGQDRPRPVQPLGQAGRASHRLARPHPQAHGQDPEEVVSPQVEPVRWIHGRLEILDQRLLPYREKYLVCRTVDQVVDAIKTLAVRGAPLLGVTGAYAVALAKDRPSAAKKLIASRPTAVNLRWAGERTLRAADPLQEARIIHAEDAAMCEAIARHGAPLLKGKRVLTICNTGALATGGIGTAFGVLLRAKATVYALETRPLRQGARPTMWEAEKCGVKDT